MCIRDSQKNYYYNLQSYSFYQYKGIHLARFNSNPYVRIMPIFNYLSPDIADYPILYPTINNNNWVSTDGEICTPSNKELIEFLANENPPLICHRKWTEKKSITR